MTQPAKILAAESVRAISGEAKVTAPNTEETPSIQNNLKKTNSLNARSLGRPIIPSKPAPDQQKQASNLPNIGKISLAQAKAFYRHGLREKAIQLTQQIADQKGDESADAWWFLATISCEMRNSALATASHKHLQSAQHLQKHIYLCNQNGMIFGDGMFVEK